MADENALYRKVCAAIQALPADCMDGNLNEQAVLEVVRKVFDQEALERRVSEQTISDETTAIEQKIKDLERILVRYHAAVSLESERAERLQKALEPFVRYIKARIALFSENSKQTYPDMLVSGTRITAELHKEDWKGAVEAFDKESTQ